MLAIIFQACLAANPGTCENHQIPIMSGGNTYRCAMLAPAQFAGWAEKHPGWQIKRWRCGVITGDTTVPAVNQ